MNRSYKICLSDYECILPELSEIIGAEYHVGVFSHAEDEFHDSHERKREWMLQGAHGILRIQFEEYEGYYYASLEADGAYFQKASDILWRTYLIQGGNPDAQEKP